MRIAMSREGDRGWRAGRAPRSSQNLPVLVNHACALHLYADQRAQSQVYAKFLSLKVVHA
jgi:hypothetical protein